MTVAGRYGVARVRVASRIGRRVRSQRGRRLTAFRIAIAEAADEIAEVLHRNGKPLLRHVEVMMALSTSSTLQRAESDAPAKVSSGVLANFARRSAALGVIGVIGPWNYPIVTPMGSIAYALAAGNAVVFKPSELTPLIGARLGEIAARTIAIPNVFQVVTGAGATGAALAKGAVDKIAFTGSSATGKKIMIAAAERLTPVLLELGGKDPMIVADDADLDKAAEAACTVR
jgi:acyl-CoA reductase-like NAD-dependent aldehyde dehydrogenase